LFSSKARVCWACYDVFDGDRNVSNAGRETWFWGVSFQLTGRQSYGHVVSLEEAKVASRVEYGAWKSGAG
jgi:hypothetical protein